MEEDFSTNLNKIFSDLFGVSVIIRELIMSLTKQLDLARVHFFIQEDKL